MSPTLAELHLRMSDHAALANGSNRGSSSWDGGAGCGGVGQTFQSPVIKKTDKSNHAHITPDGSTRVDCTAV
jgi:hypothetical protein